MIDTCNINVSLYWNIKLLEDVTWLRFEVLLQEVDTIVGMVKDGDNVNICSRLC